jgi:hypothetical protein
LYCRWLTCASRNELLQLSNPSEDTLPEAAVAFLTKQAWSEQTLQQHEQTLRCQNLAARLQPLNCIHVIYCRHFALTLNKWVAHT